MSFLIFNIYTEGYSKSTEPIDAVNMYVQNACRHVRISCDKAGYVGPVSVYTPVSVYRAMFTLSGDNVYCQPLFSTFNEKSKIKKYDFLRHDKINHFEFSPSEDMGHSGHPPSCRIKKAWSILNF